MPTFSWDIGRRVSRTFLGKFVQLAFLSPELIERVLAGEQPAQMSALALTACPALSSLLERAGLRQSWPAPY
jgi:hypothetical protein